MKSVHGRCGLGLATLLLGLLSFKPPAEAASEWVASPRTAARLIAGETVKGAQGPALLAGVQIRLEAGWKTYWRTPGDAGGVPPSFDWAGSTNLAAARVLYPAPHRYTDQAGSTVGYKEAVVFPVEVQAQDPSKPVGLKLAVEYGVCKEVCIPAEAKLQIELTGTADVETAAVLADSLAKVPRVAGAGATAASLPRLGKAAAELEGGRPRLVLDAVFPPDAVGVDMLIEAPEGLYVPLPVEERRQGDGTIRFVADLSRGVELAELKGKPLTITLISAAGSTETTWNMR